MMAQKSGNIINNRRAAGHRAAIFPSFSMAARAGIIHLTPARGEHKVGLGV
jgi:hypothetical protein